VTVSDVLPTAPPSDALMVVLPMETGLAKPALVIVATEVALEVQVAEIVMFPIVPSE
jgi:hypothetical protein